MKNLNIALRSLFKKGRSNGIKILSLGVGLAMGLVLISKVCFERSFDKFYPDSDRIYRLHENIIRDGEYKSYGQVSGGVATAMQVENPVNPVRIRIEGIVRLFKIDLRNHDQRNRQPHTQRDDLHYIMTSFFEQ